MLHYKDSGCDAKIPIVLLHGLGTDADSWYFQFASLPEKGYRLIAPDLPGFGRSTPEGKSWTIRSAARQIVGLLNDLKIHRFFLAGMSMGGTVALSLALDYPEQICGLILINTFASLRPKSLSEWRYFTRRGLRAFGRKPSDQARIVAERVFPDAEQVVFREMLVESIQNTDPRIYRQAMLELARFNVLQRLPQIKVPSVIISGEDDTTIPLKAQKELAGLIPGAKHIIIPKAGHGVMVDQPEEFNRQMCNFLAQYQGN